MLKCLISAILLAAGQSKRMGHFKQLLTVGEKALLQLTFENLKRARADETIVVLGYMADTILKTLSFEGAKVVVNRKYARGMSSSLRVGMRNLSKDSEAALIVLGDQPGVKTSTFNTIIDKFLDARTAIVIPSYRGSKGNPVLISRKFFKEVLEVRGDVGAKEIVRRHSDEVVEVEVQDKGILVDIDSPSDYSTFLRMSWGKKALT